MLIKILTPKSSFLIRIVEDANTFLRQFAGELLNNGTILSGKRECNVVVEIVRFSHGNRFSDWKIWSWWTELMPAELAAFMANRAVLACEMTTATGCATRQWFGFPALITSSYCHHYSPVV
jgi:hypothetical protein